MVDTVVQLVAQSWQVLGQMSVYLLLGFLAAGVLAVCIPPAWVERHLGGRGVLPVFTASLFGVPLPLCSCSVIPVSASIRRHGASRGATTAFLLSTPQTGVDSIAVTYALLGPVLAVFRPVAALVTGLIGGLLVHGLAEPNRGGDEETSAETACAEACCAGGQTQNAVVRALRYGFVTLPRDIGPALLVGVVLAGAMATFVPQDRLHAYVGGGFVSILLMMAVGVPVYVCATASVPIAAGFIHMGVSPGAALAFLIAGPATNAATFTTIWKIMGKRTAVLYLATVAVSALVCGLAFDALLPGVQAAIPKLGEHVHDAGQGSWLNQLAAVFLLLVVGISYGFGKNHAESDTEEGLDVKGTPARRKAEFQVRGMTCDHCAESVRRATAEGQGVLSVQVDRAAGKAVVLGDETLDPRGIAEAVARAGYEAQLVADEALPRATATPGNRGG